LLVLLQKLAGQLVMVFAGSVRIELFRANQACPHMCHTLRRWMRRDGCTRC
jgi:hypothetical protein